MEKEKYLVSIIVPVYNVERYIERCIESILAQTYKNIELILINDGSDDNSLQICNVFSNRDKRIRVIDKENTGVSSTRNIGIELARGKYLCFIDSDDYIENNYVEMLVGNIHENAVTFCGYFVDTYKENGNISSIPKIYRKENGNEISNNLVYVFHQGFLSVIWNKIYDVSRLRENNIKFDEKLSLGEDLLFNLEYLKTGVKKIESVNYSLYHYIKRGKESLDNKYRRDFLDIQENLFGKLTELSNFYNVSDKEKNILKCDFMGAIIVSIDNFYLFNSKDEKKLKYVIKKACQSIEKNEIIKKLNGKQKIVCGLRYIFIKKGLYKLDYLLRKLIKKISFIL